MKAQGGGRLASRGRSLDIVFGILGGLLLLFVVAPLAVTLAAAGPGGWLAALADPQVVASTVLTFTAAALATGVALLSGVPLAYLLARRTFRGKRWIETLISLPIVVPHTAAGVALLLVFGRRGVIGGGLAQIGLTFTENVAGIVVAMLFVSLPYLVTASREAFRLVDEDLERVAQTDGASVWGAFWLVALPAAWRGVLGGALMMWGRGISEFGAVVILAYHPKIMPVLVFERFQGFGLAAALPATAVLIVASLAVFAALRLLVGTDRSAGRGA